MKTLIVGDIHGTWTHINSLINKKNPDIVLQCGDFGWWPHFHGSKEFDGSRKPWNQYGLKIKGSKFYFCPGNHENWDSLDEIAKMNKGSNIHQLPNMENVFYCEFGSYIKLPDGRIVLFVGGAESTDKIYRTEGNSWWRQETISFSDFEKLPDINVDIIISHTIPAYFIEAFPMKFKFMYDKFADPSCCALNGVFDKYKPKQWFSGHFHKYMKAHFRGCDWESLAMPCIDEKWWTFLK